MFIWGGFMSHYFTNEDEKTVKKYSYKVNIFEKEFIFNTSDGVFSKNMLDYGSKLLLESLIVSDIKGKVLDIGCGYGPIGIILSPFKNIELHMTDINKKTLELAKENVSINNINCVKIYESYIYNEIREKFDYIISNPPIRAGKKVVYEIIGKAKEYLSKDGELWVVIRKAQGALSLIKDMSNIYNISIINKKKGYYVLKFEIKP